MITFSCPGCQATFRLPDEMAGKSARCSKCNHRFSVPGGAAPVAAGALTPSASVAKPAAATKPAATTAPKPAAASTPAPAMPAPPAAAPRKVALNPVPEVLEAEIVDDEPPRPAKQSEPVYDDVEIADLDDRPPRRVARRAEDVDDVEEYDEDEDEGRPRRRRRKQGGGSLGWILATLGGVSFVLMIIFMIMMIVSAGGGGGGGAPIVNPQIANGMFQDNNALTRGDPQDRMFFRSRFKEYRIEMQQGKTYVLDLESAMFDCWLRILDGNGAILFQDDDGGQGLNSRIVFTPNQTAQYTIICTSLDGRLGGYRLTIREQNVGVK